MAKPKIRFKGYTDDWEQRKLGEIAFSFEYGLNAAAKEYDGENKYIRITDIDNNTHEFLTYNLTSPDIDLTDAENYKLAEGDILLARTGASVGKSYIYRDSDGLVYYAGFLIRARIREEYDAEFVFQSTLTDKYNKYIAVTSQRSGQPGMNAQEYSEFEILVPEKEEQTKIGTYFRILDHLITLHQRKNIYFYEKVTLVWEQRKLEDIMDTVTDYVAAGSFEDIRNNVTYLNEPGYAQLVRTVDLKKKFTNNDSIYVDESAFKYLWRVNLNEECIVLPNIGANIGEVYFVEPSGLPYDNNVLGPNAILLKANEDTYFAFTALNNLTFQKQLFENVGSSGQPKFNKTELKSIQLYMPQNEEQEKIGQYFRDLDHLITLHQCKCHLLHKLLHNDWEQRKLGEVLDDMYNGQTPSRKRDEYWNGNIRWLSSGELNRGIVYSSIETITEEGKKSANLRVVPKGTFVMAITGLEASGTRGNCALLGFDTTLNQSCMALFPKQDILISQFLFQWYRMVGEEYGINYTQGTKQQSYNAELIKILPILLPSIDEQKKIASYLNSIDHLITLHHRKYIYILKSP